MLSPPVTPGRPIEIRCPDYGPPTEHFTAEELGLGSQKPNDFAHDDFFVNSQGVFVRRNIKGELIEVWISSRIDVIALARSAESEEWGSLIRFQDRDGVWHQWCIPWNLLGGDPSGFCKTLMGMGAIVSAQKRDRDDLARYLMSVEPGSRCLAVSKPGWHDNRFVLPDGTGAGVGNGETIALQMSDPLLGGFVKARGTLADWQREVAAKCRGNSRLQIAMSVAFTGPVLHWLGEESGGFHFRGNSSIGKTTILLVASSVWGRPTKFIRPWRATANGLEAVAVQHHDMLLVLDEMSQISPHEVGQAVYMLSNSQGKSRATQTGAARAASDWRLMFLSSGEIGLRAHIESGGERPMAGQETRVVDIEADAGGGHGIYEALHGASNGAEFSLMLKDAAERFHGIAGRTWAGVLADPDRRARILDSIKAHTDEFVRNNTPHGADGQVQRVARRFGLIAAVGEVCQQVGILPWDEGEATRAARIGFTDWLNRRGGSGSLESDQILEQVRRFFELHGEARFTPMGHPGIGGGEECVDDNHRMTLQRAGFRQMNDDGQTDYYVLPEAFKRDVCSGRELRQVITALRNAGHLVIANDGKAQVAKRLPGMGVCKVYHIRSTIFGG
nr:DUF927 domain-containing protein [Pigmentiphaga humi]